MKGNVTDQTLNSTDQIYQGSKQSLNDMILMANMDHIWKMSCETTKKQISKILSHTFPAF